MRIAGNKFNLTLSLYVFFIFMMNYNPSRVYIEKLINTKPNKLFIAFPQPMINHQQSSNITKFSVIISESSEKIKRLLYPYSYHTCHTTIQSPFNEF